YYRLYLLTNNEYYRKRVTEIADIVERIKNENWTWYYYDGSKYIESPVSLYNQEFTELFLCAYELTKDPKYREFAKNTINALPELLYSVSPTAVYNYFFYPFIGIAYYLYHTGEDNKELLEAGEFAYYMAMQGYNPNTKKWYYSPSEYIRDFYDGHSALYQMGEITSFLQHQEAVKAIFPEQYNYLIKEIPGMLEIIKKYQLPSGAYYYNENAPDCTESLGGVIVFYTLYDKTFKTDHSSIISRCINTILKRQAPSGAYYKTDVGSPIEIWYGDNIGVSLPLYFLLKEKNSEDRMTEEFEIIKKRKSKDIIIGDYDLEIRDNIGRLDVINLIERLKDLRINTYAYLIWHSNYDWDDLIDAFMPLAQREGINVIVYLVPPSEPPSPKPYEYDYVKWAEAIGELSKRYPNVTGIAIDDFNYNTGFFTRTYLKEVKSKLNTINPSLKLFTVSYYRDITDKFLDQYRDIIDGIIFPFRNEPSIDTTTIATLEPQVRAIRATLGDDLFLIIMIYASKLSSAPVPPDARYLEETVRVSLDLIREGVADGIITYCLPKNDKDDDRYRAVKELFNNFYIGGK
ncbi:MAG: hypothetical protein N2380_08835, partial [bacterium]|nr:hypothetical protein [bacterium]